MLKRSTLDRLSPFPYGTSALTSAAVKSERFGDWLMGTHPKIVKAQYQPAETPADSIATWAHYLGDPTGTTIPRPALYKMVATTAVDGALLQEAYEEVRAEHPDAYAVLAWKFPGKVLGNAAMCAAVSAEDMRAIFVPGFRYSMRIARGDLHTTAGVFAPQTGELTVPDGVVRAGPVGDMANYRLDVPIY